MITTNLSGTQLFIMGNVQFTPNAKTAIENQEYVNKVSLELQRLMVAHKICFIEMIFDGLLIAYHKDHPTAQKPVMYSLPRVQFSPTADPNVLNNDNAKLQIIHEIERVMWDYGIFKIELYFNPWTIPKLGI